MVEDEGKKEKGKFEFTPKGEALAYIGPDQARVQTKGMPATTPTSMVANTLGSA